MKGVSISVIVPVFNVANFVKRCAVSLFEQTCLDVEFIFVNDGTLDDSKSIIEQVLKSYPTRYEQVIIIDHPTNLGLPAARNTGLKHARGEYIYHFDADDWADPKLLEDLLVAAKSSNADIVYSDWFLAFSKKIRYMEQPKFSRGQDCVCAMLRGGMKYNVWNKLVKRELYLSQNIIFPEQYGMGEDMTMIMLFCHTDKICYVNNAYYYYNQINSESFTKNKSINRLAEIKENVSRIERYLNLFYKVGELNKSIILFKLNVKLPLLITLDRKSYSIWRDCYPETNTNIHLNPDFTWHIKLIQYAAKYRLDFLVWFYNYILFKFVYNMLK